MEQDEQGKHYGEALIDEIMPYTSLTKEDRAKLVELARKLEDEFGDLRINSQRIQELFWEEFGRSSCELSDKRHNVWLDEKYIGKRDEITLWNYVTNHPEILEESSRMATEYICMLLRARFEEGVLAVINGGAKSHESISQRMELEEDSGTERGIKRFLDLTRGRVVVKDIETLWIVYLNLFQHFYYNEIEVLSKRNRYANRVENWREKSEETNPFLCANLVIALDNDVTYELQIITERAARIAALDHPARVKPEIPLIEEELRYLEALAWGSHLMDARDYNEKNPPWPTRIA